MTTLTLADYTPPRADVVLPLHTNQPCTVIQFDHRRTAVMRGIAESVWLAGVRYGLQDADCARLARAAKRAYKTGQASPAGAIADAVAIMRRRARQGGAA